MRLDRFDLNLLVTLDALLETCNVTRASEQLHIGQSACSAALARLREHFDNELLVPMGRQLVPTPLALTLRGPVREALLRSRDVITRRSIFDPASTTAAFEVCSSDYAMMVLLAPLMQKLATEAPGVSLQLRSAPGELLVAFEQGRVDMMILPSNLDLPTQHGREMLFEDTLVAVIDEGNPHVTGTQISADQLADLKHVVVRFGGDSDFNLEEWQFPQLKSQWAAACFVDRFNLVPIFLTGTSYVAVVPRLLANRFAATHRVRITEMPPGMTSLFQIDLTWPRHVDDAPAHRWLRERLIREARNLSP